MEHEVGHVHDARTNTDQYGRDSQHTKDTKGKTPHDNRPEEKRANQFKDQVNKERQQFKKNEQQQKKMTSRKRSRKIRTEGTTMGGVVRGSTHSKKTAWSFIFWLAIALSPALYCSGQTPRAAAVEGSLEQMAEELRPQYGPVRFHREEELEEQFVASAPAPDVLSLAPHFFQVQGQQFQISGAAVVERIQTGVPTLYIATSPDGTKTYKLAGFPSAEDEFNRLVAESPAQKIRRNAEAESRGLLCAELVYGLSSAWWIDDDSSAKLQAAKYFFNQGHRDGFALADKWWRPFRNGKRAMKITTTKSNDAFTVNLPLFWAPVEGASSPPQIKLYSIKVSASGTCHGAGQSVYK